MNRKERGKPRERGNRKFVQCIAKKKEADFAVGKKAGLTNRVYDRKKGWKGGKGGKERHTWSIWGKEQRNQFLPGRKSFARRERQRRRGGGRVNGCLQKGKGISGEGKKRNRSTKGRGRGRVASSSMKKGAVSCATNELGKGEESPFCKPLGGGKKKVKKKKFLRSDLKGEEIV